MSVCRFFPLPQTDDVYEHVRNDVMHTESCILIGDKETCKSSLLFQAALSFASEGEQVLYVCPQALTSKPRRVHGMMSDNPALCQHLKMVYIQESQALIEYFSSFHKQNCLPVAFIIDNFDAYIHQLSTETYMEHAFANLSSLIVDTIGFVMQKRERACHLLVAMSDLKLENLLPVCKLYFRDIWISSVDHAEEHVSSHGRRFHMSNTGNPVLRIRFHADGDTIIFDKLARLKNDSSASIETVEL